MKDLPGKCASDAILGAYRLVESRWNNGASRVKNQLSVRAITRNYPTKYVALVHSFPRLH